MSNDYEIMSYAYDMIRKAYDVMNDGHGIMSNGYGVMSNGYSAIRVCHQGVTGMLQGRYRGVTEEVGQFALSTCHE
jgi:hypothetical protein